MPTGGRRPTRPSMPTTSVVAPNTSMLFGEQARNPAPRLHADELHRERRSARRANAALRHCDVAALALVVPEHQQRRRQNHADRRVDECNYSIGRQARSAFGDEQPDYRPRTKKGLKKEPAGTGPSRLSAPLANVDEPAGNCRRCRH